MLRNRKFTFLLALLVLAGLMLTACGPKTKPGEPTPGQGNAPATAGKPAVGGEITLRLAKDPDSLNPIISSSAYGSEVYALVYATLFDFNEKFEPTPYVADTWKFSEDGKTITINLKKGVKFHDGSELTSADVVFTLKSIMDPGYTGPRAADLADVADVKAADPYTVVVTLKEPSAPILENLNYGILEAKQFQGVAVKDMDKAEANFKPIGAGPYKFVDFKRGQYVVLERNADWFMSQQYGGAPFIQKITYKVIPEDATAEAALENGEIDWLEPDPKDVSRLTKDYADKLVEYKWERNGWGYITLNVTRPHLNNKLVRQALTLALDRKSIIDGLMDGRAVIPAGPIPPVSWAFDPSLKPAPYDVNKAKSLLEQAGYKMNAQGIMEKDGQPLKLGFYASSGSSLIEGIAAIAKKNWKDIGVDLDVQLMDFNALLDNYMKPGKFDVTFSGMSLSLDPDQTNLFHSKSVNGFNRGRYANPEVDKLLDQGVRETDPAKRKAIYTQYQQIMADDAPVIFVYANQYSHFVSKRIKGVVNYPGAGADFGYIYRWYINEK
jgi:peptide/nickel transport system substrate-binding protein